MAALTTYGDLRKILKDEGLLWTVNPKFADDQKIVRRPLGLAPKALPKADPKRRVDVAALVAADPPTNLPLRNYLIERKILPAEKAAIFDSPGSTGPHAIGSGGGGTFGTHAPSVDWRNRFGWSWITQIRDQDPCEHCWIYAATALVEAMVHIEHCVWCLRSEGDYIEANGIWCGHCGGPEAVLNWVQAHGITDPDCVPWVDRDPGDRSGAYFNPPPSGCSSSGTAPPAWHPCPNRSGRTVKTPAYTGLSNIEDQKHWIDAIGPLVVGFDVYDDFSGWSGTNPYIKSASAHAAGGHVMLAVGYDDHAQCWIVKNSWGTGFGNAGYYLIGYGQCNIDYYTKFGLQYTSPDPWTKRRPHGGGIVESGNGSLHRNFEFLGVAANNQFAQWWRDNSSGTLPWARAAVLGNNDVADQPTFTSTTYNRNFECVYPTTGGRLHHWWFDQAAGRWNSGEVFGPTNARGPVGFIESSFGPGNFELVVNASGEIQHWWRDTAFNWHQATNFGSSIREVGYTLLQGTYGGNLEMVAVLENGTMQHWWRGNAATDAWAASATFGSGISSPPCMIEGQFGMADEYGHGNFELCVALPNGTVQHWWRNNQISSMPWANSATFGSGVDCVVALLQGSFGHNLEMIVWRQDGGLQHYWRDDGGWHAGVVFGSVH